MEGQVVTSLYETKAKDYVRVLANYNNKLISLIWLMVGKDGSVYISPSKKEIKSFRKGTSNVAHGELSVNYEEGEVIEDLTSLRSKTSFHASGLINSIDSTRSYRSLLREVQELDLLCMFVFQHPDKMEAIGKVKKRDVGINFFVRDENPLLAYVFVSPLEIVQPLIHEGFKEQSNIILTYKELENCKNIAIQINVLSLKEGNEWSRYTTMAYPTKN